MSKRLRPNRDRPNPVNPALDQAILASQAGRHDEAERLASGLLKADRSNVLAARVLATALMAQDRLAEAIEPLQPVARRSEDPAIETLLARALLAAGRRDEALDQLRRATTRRPAFPLAFLDLANELGATGRFDEGVAVFESGLALTPEVAILRVGLGYLHLQRNDRAKARVAFSEVLTAEPQRHDAMVALARTLALEGDHAAAADLYRQALQLEPQAAAVRINLARCLLDAGARDAGETALRAAVRSDPRQAAPATLALADAAHGRFFLRPSAAAKFLRGGAA